MSRRSGLSALPLLLLCCLLVGRGLCWSPGGFPNQLGRRPPRGWRSWNAFGDDVSQERLLRIARALAAPRDSDTGRSLVPSGDRERGEGGGERERGEGARRSEKRRGGEERIGRGGEKSQRVKTREERRRGEEERREEKKTRTRKEQSAERDEPG